MGQVWNCQVIEEEAIIFELMNKIFVSAYGEEQGLQCCIFCLFTNPNPVLWDTSLLSSHYWQGVWHVGFVLPCYKGLDCVPNRKMNLDLVHLECAKRMARHDLSLLMAHWIVWVSCSIQLASWQACSRYMLRDQISWSIYQFVSLPFCGHLLE